VTAIATPASYLLVTHALGGVGSIAKPDDELGGMWAVLATIFVFRARRHHALERRRRQTRSGSSRGQRRHRP
jgi:hypothetical protein